MSQVLLSRPASQLGSGSKQPGVPNLPEIPHPLSRLGNPDKLNVRGLSSSHGRPLSNPTKPGEIPFSNITPRVSKSSSGRHASATERKSLPKIPQPFQSIPEGVEVVHTEDNKAKLPVFGKSRITLPTLIAFLVRYTFGTGVLAQHFHDFHTAEIVLM